MILKSFGCSFIFGTDLADAGKNERYSFGSYLTWPSLLAKDLVYDYQCYAKPGSGNLQIAERLLNQVNKNDLALYVIGWSWIDRFDYISDDELWAGGQGTKWATVMPTDSTTVARKYYKTLHDQYRDKLTTLMYIRLAIDTLKQHNLPFIMTYVDDLIFETEWHSSQAVVNLQNYIKPHMTTFEGQSFLEWSKKKNFPISKSLHPLEEAHQAAFELIKSYNLV